MADSDIDSDDGFGIREPHADVDGYEVDTSGKAVFKPGRQWGLTSGDTSPGHRADLKRQRSLSPSFGELHGSVRKTFAEHLEHSVKVGLPPDVIERFEDPNITSSMLNVQLRMSRRTSTPETLKQPWEKGFMGMILGNDSTHPFLQNNWLRNPIPLPPILRTDQTVSKGRERLVEPTSFKRPVVSSAVLKIRRVATPEFVGDPMRFRALSRWRLIVSLDLNSSVVGRQIVEYVLDGRAEVLIVQTLEDALNSKSTNTLLKRSSSLLKYLAFTRAHFKALGLTYREPWVYKFLCFMRESKSAATSGKSVLEAMEFATHVIGADVLDKDWKSSRVRGVADSMYVRKAVLNQADALFVTEVKILHHILENSKVVLDQVVAGYDLLCCYGVCRWADPQRPRRVKYDIVNGTGYFEVETTAHKTASSAEKKTIICPIVATSPGLGTPENCWIDLWILARESVGLEFVTMPTMPQIMTDGSFGLEPMTAGDGTMWLRDLLQSYGPKLDPSRKIVSHSLKTTILSWAAKRPLKKSLRRALGHHLDSADQSVATYSRDYLFAALQALDIMINDIKQQRFFPDDSRAQRALAAKKVKPLVQPSWVPVVENSGERRVSYVVQTDQSEPTAQEVNDQAEVMGEEESSSDEKSSSSSGSSDASLPDAVTEDSNFAELMEDKPLESRVPFTDHNGDPIELYQHTVSGTLHAKKDDAKLLCGRAISRSFSRIKGQLQLRWPKCEICNKKAPNPRFLCPTAKASSSKGGP